MSARRWASGVLAAAVAGVLVAAPGANAEALAHASRAHVAAGVTRHSALRFPTTAAGARTFSPLRSSPATRAVTTATPSTVRRVWQGTHDDGVDPASLSSAVGPTRFVMLDNSQDTIYDRTHDTYLSWDTLFQLTGDLFADSITDPQVIWDPTTSRFYYSALDTPGNGEYWLDIGWSTTASPTTTDDWCKYSYRDYGTLYPDEPKLGDTKDFFVVGADVYDSTNAFQSADVLAFPKPANGDTSCGDSLPTYQKRGLRTGSGLPAYAPVPVNATDTASTGYVLARSGPLPSTSLSEFTVSRAADGSAVISGTGSDIAVPSWTSPPNAPQAGSSMAIDTGDGRLPQAISAVDPSRGGALAIWTQHTVAGGAGSAVRWYEIDPVHRSLFQSGTVSSPSVDYYDASISPDRRVNGSSASYGSSMTLLANASSVSAPISLVAVTKRGTAAATAPAVVGTSPGPHVAFDCDSLSSISYCRWGDYASASPDPASPVGAASGQVWSTGQLSSGSPIEELGNWTSWNVVMAP